MFLTATRAVLALLLTVFCGSLILLGPETSGLKDFVFVGFGARCEYQNYTINPISYEDFLIKFKPKARVKPHYST